MGKISARSTKDVKEFLEHLFGDNFEFHPKFFEELSSLLFASGNQKIVIRKLINLLDTILQLDDIDYGPNWIEHLKEYGNMYSLHIVTRGVNYRLLFSKTTTGKLFLHAFYERNDSRVNSYANHVRKAIERREQWKEERLR